MSPASFTLARRRAYVLGVPISREENDALKRGDVPRMGPRVDENNAFAMVANFVRRESTSQPANKEKLLVLKLAHFGWESPANAIHSARRFIFRR